MLQCFAEYSATAPRLSQNICSGDYLHGAE